MTEDPPGRIRILFLVLAVLWGWLIFEASSTPSDAEPAPIPMQLLWNGSHAFVFGVLGSLVLAGLPSRRGWWIGGMVACCVYGALDEWHQASVAGRVASVRDWFTDVCGVVLALAFVLWLRARDQARFRRVLLAGLLCFVAAAIATIP